MTNSAGIRKRCNQILMFALVVASLSLVLAPSYSLLSASDGSDVVLTVNGVAITRDAFYDRLEIEVGEQVLEQMIAEELLRQKAEDPSLGVTDDEITERYNEIRAQFPDDRTWQATLAQYKITEDGLRNEIGMSLIIDALSAKDVSVSEEEIKSYFDANKDSLGTQEQIRASHILVENEDEAKAILTDLEAGADFAAIAGEKSLDQGSKVAGGDLGYFTRGQMIPEFENAAFALKIDEVSAPVKTQYGWHIIKLTDRKEAIPAVFEELRDRIEETLTAQKAKPAEEVLQELMSAADISVTWDKYSALDSKKPEQSQGQPQ